MNFSTPQRNTPHLNALPSIISPHAAAFCDASVLFIIPAALLCRASPHLAAFYISAHRSVAPHRTPLRAASRLNAGQHDASVLLFIPRHRNTASREIPRHSASQRAMPCRIKPLCGAPQYSTMHRNVTSLEAAFRCARQHIASMRHPAPRIVSQHFAAPHSAPLFDTSRHVATRDTASRHGTA